MLKIIVKTLPIITLSIFLNGCILADYYGSGVKVSENRYLNSFTEIEIDSAVSVNITQGTRESISISGDDNLLKIIKTEVKNGVLYIYNYESFYSSMGVVIDIVVNDINYITLDGVGDINLSNINKSQLSLELNGVGDITANGSVSFLSVNLSGTGQMNLFNLYAERVDANLSGVGDMDLYVTSNIDITLTGIGSITYKGAGTISSCYNTGIGSIAHRY